MSPPEKPVVVIVPECWCVPAMYRKLVEALEAQSLQVQVPALPTNNGARPPNSTYQDDLAAVRAAVESIVSDGKEVLLLLHSYGSLVGCDAIHGLARKDRQAQGLAGGVVHIIYLSGHILAKGQSIAKSAAEAGLGHEVALMFDIEADGTWIVKDPEWILYHDLEREDQTEQRKLIVRSNMACSFSEPTYEGWRDVSGTYVRTSQNRVLSPACQDLAIANGKVTGLPFEVVEWNCGHSTYAKYPKELADLVVKAISSVS